MDRQSAHQQTNGRSFGAGSRNRTPLGGGAFARRALAGVVILGLSIGMPTAANAVTGPFATTKNTVANTVEHTVVNTVEEQPPVTPTEAETADPAEGAQVVTETPAPTISSTLEFGGELLLVPAAQLTAAIEPPVGLTPVQISGNLSGPSGQSIEVRSNSRVITTLDAATGAFTLPISAADLTAEGVLALSFSYSGQFGTWCYAGTSQANQTQPAVVVSDLRAGFTGTAVAPTTVADFFTSASTVTIELAADANEELIAAGLDLVAGATQMMGDSSAAHLVFAGSAEAEALQTELADIPQSLKRKVILLAGEGEAVTSIAAAEDALAQLTITGSAEALRAATAAFGETGIALASEAETTQLDGSGVGQDVTSATRTLTLAELGNPNISLQGYGVQERYIEISQSEFGVIADQIDFTLNGVASVTESTIANVEVLWNAQLVDAFTIAADENVFAREISIPAASLRGTNGLVLKMHAVSTNAECVDERLLPQVRLDVDAVTSTVTTHRGDTGATRFQDFPQAFAGELQLAFGAAPTTAEVASAANLVGSLQRSSAVRLQVSGVTAGELLASDGAGVLVGATAEQAQQLQTPVRFAQLRALATEGGELTVSVDAPFAALQATGSNGRAVLVLGSYQGDSEQDGSGVLLATTSGLNGSSWAQLDGRVLLSTSLDEPVVLDPNAVVPQDESKQDYLPALLWGAAFLVLLIAVGVIAAAARKRRRRAVERVIEVERAMPAEDRPTADEVTAADQTSNTTGGAEVVTAPSEHLHDVASSQDSATPQDPATRA